MKLIQTTFLLFSLLCMAAPIFSQSTSRLGLGVSTYDQSRLSLTYSMLNEEGRALNFRVSYGEGSQFNLYDQRIVVPVEPEENNYLSERTLGENTVRGRLAIGPEFKVNESKFTAGIEGLIGVAKYKRTLTEGRRITDENGFLETAPSLIPFGENLTITENVERLFISPGVQARLAFNTIVTGDIHVQLYAAATVEQDFTIDSSSSSDGSSNELGTGKISQTNLNTSVGAIVYWHR